MFRRTILIALFVSLLFICTVNAQDTSDDDDVVKITTTLVQIDAVVTDKKGKQVSDLTADDFELVVEGKKREITHFSYISIAPQPVAANADQQNRDAVKSNVVIPTSRLRPEQVRRTYAIVVDDLGISVQNIPDIKHALKKFIDEDVQQGDFVAIIRTGGGSGTLQSFTSDKRQLLAAVDKIRFNFFGRGGVQAFEPIRTSLKEDLAGQVDEDGSVSTPQGIEEENAFDKSAAELRKENFEAGTIGALGFVIRGMAKLPGRKSVILFSEGFSSLDSSGPTPISTQIFEKLRVLAEYANRSSVVFYTVDPRGLEIAGMALAQDDVRTIMPDEAINFGGRLTNREDSFRDTQSTLRFLAYETGGVPFLNNNNLSKGLDRAMEDQKGYYLIGYEPDDETFDASKPKYNNVRLSLKRDDLDVRTRNGFYGIVDKPEPEPEANLNIVEQMYVALTSPFDSSGVELNVNAIFMAGDTNEKLIKTLIHIKGSDLTFTKQADGTLKANFDFIAMFYGLASTPLSETTRNFSVTLSDDNYRQVLERGLIYSLNVPVKKEGAYQFRIAVRDSASGKVGSASQFLTVPKIENKKLTMSGIVVNRYSGRQWQQIMQRVPGAADGYVNDLDNAQRLFSKGDVIQYSYMVYNVKPGTNLLTQTRLLKDGKVVVQGQPAKVDTSEAGRLNRIESNGAITLGTSLETGHYILQVVVTDTKKKKYTTQWVEFELEEPAVPGS